MLHSTAVRPAIFRTAPDMQQKRIEYARRYKTDRDPEPVKKALSALSELVSEASEANFMESIMEAVKAKATLQEICDAMRQASDFHIPK